MDVKQCMSCRKLYHYRGSVFCTECTRAQDKLFDKVRNYIYDNPRSSIDDICENTGVEYRLIVGWIKENRLIRSSDAPSSVRCENCQRPISSGRFCEDCSNSMRSRLEGAARSMAPPPAKDVKKDAHPGSRIYIHEWKGQK